MSVMKRVYEAVGMTALKRTPRMVQAAVTCVAVGQKEGMLVECALPRYTTAQRKRINAMARAIEANL